MEIMWYTVEQHLLIPRDNDEDGMCNPPPPPPRSVVLPDGYTSLTWGMSELFVEDITLIGTPCNRPNLSPAFHSTYRVHPECIHTHCTLGRDPCYWRRQTVGKFPQDWFRLWNKDHSTLLSDIYRSDGRIFPWVLARTRTNPTLILVESTTFTYHFLAREFDVTTCIISIYHKQLRAQSSTRRRKAIDNARGGKEGATSKSIASTLSNVSNRKLIPDRDSEGVYRALLRGRTRARTLCPSKNGPLHKECRHQRVVRQVL